MSGKIVYKEEPMDNIQVVPDFLPKPKELAFKEETIKITISLSKTSIDFFKKQANVYHTQYQKMIRRLLDEYVTIQKKAS
jgi:predicted DNA binding CopG/RHH family protein